MYILDLTAGWGKDAGILASCGAKIVMIEKDPILSVLLEDAINNMDEISKTKMDLHFLSSDSKIVMQELTQKPDVIYLDPMHPQRKKTALTKKTMQLLQASLEVDEKSPLALLKMALEIKAKRTVIKWPQKIKPLLKPSYSIFGKTVRFDVFYNH